MCPKFMILNTKALFRSKLSFPALNRIILSVQLGLCRFGGTKEKQAGHRVVTY